MKNHQLNKQEKKQIVNYSFHSTARASQRGIKHHCIDFLISNGKVIFKQGLRYYYMPRKELKFYDKNIAECLKNLIVITTSDSNLVITCYKNKNAIKRIKHKRKQLRKKQLNERELHQV